jgi:hypothetical protein
VNDNDYEIPSLSRVEDIQSKIDQWKELTSNLESIKEQMFGETSSTPQRNDINGEVKQPHMNWYNESMPSSDTDRINPLESQLDSEFVTDVPVKIDQFPESSFTPIKEDDYENELVSSFPSSF